MTTGADVKAARSAWNIWTRVREVLKQLHRIEEAALRIAGFEKACLRSRNPTSTMSR